MSLPRSLAVALVALASLLAGVRQVVVAELRASQGCEMSCCAPSEPSCCDTPEDAPRMSSGCGCCGGPSGLHVLGSGVDWLPVTVESDVPRPAARRTPAATEPLPRSQRPAPRPKPPRA